MTTRRFLLAGWLLFTALCSVAQSQTPTASQMAIFQNLPPEQQQAILEGLATEGGESTRRDRDLEMPGTSQSATGAGATRGRGTTAAGRAAVDALDVDLEPRIEGGDTVLIDMKLRLAVPPVVRTPDEQKRVDEVLERALKGNPYRLDRGGLLRIPGLAPIALAGLTEVQATARLRGEPALRDFDAQLTLLPLERQDEDALEPFGYEIFEGAPTTFAPVSEVPVPAQYVVGPGDRLEVQLIGSTTGRYSLVVNRDGRVMFPELGPIAVARLTFPQAKALIEARVAEQMIGTQAVVSMSDLRSIRVFVLGEARQPGSYTVSGLSTITNALLVSGGVMPIGSLRNIQLKRNGQLVRRLDLYDLLLRGDTSDDVRLQPGDVIFIPPVGPQVGVTGEIRRPAIYELSGPTSVGELVALSGGLTPEADPRLARLARINEQQQRVVLDVDLAADDGRGLHLKSGDLLRVQAVRPVFSNSIQLDGHVHRPAAFQHRAGLRLSDVLTGMDDLKPNADAGYVLIRREVPGTRRVQALSADLHEAWAAPHGPADPLLAPRDRIYVFDLQTGRERILAPFLEELRLQAQSEEPTQIVRVGGSVRAPGDYPLEQGMTISDLVRAGGSLGEAAFGGDAELARYEVRDGVRRQTDVVKVDLGRAIAGDPAADLVLRSQDFLVIKQISEWSEQETVRLEGEVRFPGEYPIERGESMRSVIARAGGLTTLAFPQGSVFTREDLQERERRQLELLATRLRQDLGTLALQAAQSSTAGAQQASETLTIGQSLLTELQSAQPTGRLVIDLDRVLSATDDPTADVILKGGDTLRIPRTSQEVTVIGEVQNSTSHLFQPGLDRDAYIRISGGLTQKADDDRIYVVRANGSVEAGSGSAWFRNDAAGAIRPGDTIVVPLDAERMRPLALWTAVSTIIYNIAIAVAAVNSF
jgi:polysaccharide biosynthesis/export protein